MAMANMNLIGVFVAKLWHVQALACGGGDGGGNGGDGGATKNIIFGDIITLLRIKFLHVNQLTNKNKKGVYESINQAINQFISEYVHADIIYIIMISIYSCTIFTGTQITIECCNFYI